MVSRAPLPARRCVEVVGAVGDARLADLHDTQPMFVFVPILQEPAASVRSPTVVMRIHEPLDGLVPDLTRRVEALGQDFAVRLRTLRQQVDVSLMRERLLVAGGRYFGSVAGVLVAIGLYGTLASSVARRTREIAVRAALGAQRRALFAMVFKQMARLNGLGLTLGLPSAWIATRVLRDTFVGQTADVATLGSVCALVTALGFAAAWVPAHRAVAIAPMQALREE